MTDITQDLAALDAALESWPTHGPWHATKPESHGTGVRGPAQVSLAWCGCATTVGEEGCYSIGAAEAAANAHFIATCSPDRIRRLLRAVKARDEEIERLRTQVRNFEESSATDGLHPSHKVAWADAIDVLRKRNDRLAAVIGKALKALGDIQKLPPERGMAQNFARKTARELRLMLKAQQEQEQQR